MATLSATVVPLTALPVARVARATAVKVLAALAVIPAMAVLAALAVALVLLVLVVQVDPVALVAVPSPIMAAPRLEQPVMAVPGMAVLAMVAQLWVQLVPMSAAPRPRAAIAAHWAPAWAAALSVVVPAWAASQAQAIPIAVVLPVRLVQASAVQPGQSRARVLAPVSRWLQNRGMAAPLGRAALFRRQLIAEAKVMLVQVLPAAQAAIVAQMLRVAPVPVVL